MKVSTRILLLASFLCQITLSSSFFVSSQNGISMKFQESSALNTRVISPRKSRELVVRMEAGDSKPVEIEIETRMKKSLESIENKLSSLRTGRPNVSMLDRVMVDYYGTPTPLNQVAGVSVAGSQSITVTPYDKAAFKDIEVAIMESDLGIMPNNEGNMLRLNIPPLTEDRRKEMSKVSKGVGEDGKVALRNLRREAIDKVKKLEKDSKISKDESAESQERIQKLTDKYTSKTDEMCKTKEKEIMKV